eukprot:2887479-Rhodomonas_salina.5
MLSRFAAKPIRAVSARFASAAVAQPDRSMDMLLGGDLSMGVHMPKATKVKEEPTAPVDASLLAADLSFPVGGAAEAAQARDAACLWAAAEALLSKAAGNWELEFTTLKYEEMVAKQELSPKAKEDYKAAATLARGQMWSNA